MFCIFLLLNMSQVLLKSLGFWALEFLAYRGRFTKEIAYYVQNLFLSKFAYDN